MNKELMQQALEALELAYRTSYSETNCVKFSGVIATLRKALAQPVQTAIAAQAGQSEPVARVAASFLGRADVLLCNGENVLPFGTELYTHPAPTIAQPVEVQRVGLTDKQIYAAIASTVDEPEPFSELIKDKECWDDVTSIVRAIERAHGIKPASESGA